MARTSIAVLTPKGTGTATTPATGLVLTETAADIVNNNSTPFVRGLMLVAHNTDVGAQTVTITSVADEYGRSGDIATFSIVAGGIAVFGPFNTDGWRQTDGHLYYTASAATVKFAPLNVGGY